MPTKEEYEKAKQVIEDYEKLHPLPPIQREMSQYLRLEPQPNIIGSYVQDDEFIYYSESDDLDRLAGKPPEWLTLTCPFGVRGELVCLKGTWFWKGY